MFAFDVVAAVAVQEEIALVIEHDALLFLRTVLLLAYLQGPALLFHEEIQWYPYHIPPWLSGFDFRSFFHFSLQGFSQFFTRLSSYFFPTCFVRLDLLLAHTRSVLPLSTSIATSSSESWTSTPLCFTSFLRFALNFSKRRLKCCLVERFVTWKWMSLFSFSLFAISWNTFLRFTVLGLKHPQTDLSQGRLLPNPLAPDHSLDWEVGRWLCNNTLACLPW